MALGISNEIEACQSMPSTEEGVWLWSHSSWMSGHMPRAASSVGAEAVTAPRDDFTNRQQSICACAQEKLPQLSHLNLAMPEGQEWIQVAVPWLYIRCPAQSSSHAHLSRRKVFSFSADTGIDHCQTQHLDRCTSLAC